MESCIDLVQSVGRVLSIQEKIQMAKQPVPDSEIDSAKRLPEMDQSSFSRGSCFRVF